MEAENNPLPHPPPPIPPETASNWTTWACVPLWLYKDKPDPIKLSHALPSHL